MPSPLSPRSLALALLILSGYVQAQSVLIPVPDRRGHVFDQSRGLLYIATINGCLERFDVEQESFLTPFPVGARLNGLDTTPAEDFVYVAEDLEGATQGLLYKVNLDSGAVKALAYDKDSGEAGSWDIGIANNGLGFFTTRISGSGWTPIREIDLATDTLTARMDVPGSGPGGEVRQDTPIYRGSDRSLLVMAEPNTL